MNEFGVGDIVLVAKGRKTNFYEVIEIEKDVIWISDGWVQIRIKPDEMKLICKAENRQDDRVPFMRYVK